MIWSVDDVNENVFDRVRVQVPGCSLMRRPVPGGERHASRHVAILTGA